MCGWVNKQQTFFIYNLFFWCWTFLSMKIEESKAMKRKKLCGQK